MDRDGDDAIEYGGNDCDDDDETFSSIVPEIWYDGIDQNCDGRSDYDQDLDGFESEEYGGDDCNDSNYFINPSMTDEDLDGKDQDCNGVDGLDNDGDLHAHSEFGGDDCDDSNPNIHPGQPEDYLDGLDNDCDGYVDLQEVNCVSNVLVDFADNTRRPMNLCENLDLTTRFSYSNSDTPQLVYFNANFMNLGTCSLNVEQTGICEDTDSMMQLHPPQLYSRCIRLSCFGRRPKRCIYFGHGIC